MLAEIVGLKGASSLPGWKRSSKLRGSEVHKTAGLKNTSVCRAVKGGRLSPDWQAFAGPMESDRLERAYDGESLAARAAPGSVFNYRLSARAAFRIST